MGKIFLIRTIRIAFLISIVVLLFTTASIQSQSVRIVFSVPDVELNRGDTVFLDIGLDNFQDTIAGFQFQLQTMRPDLVRFMTDGGQTFDTTGTLVSGFEYVQVIDSSFAGEKYWFRCIANVFGFDNINERGFGPQQGGVAVRVPIIVSPLPDLTAGNISDLIIIKPFDFSDPNANSIGVITDTIYDTTFYECTSWVLDTICLNWVELPDGNNGYDSMHTYSYLYGYVDTTVVIPVHGSITVIENMCDNDLSGEINVSDLTCLVSYLWPQGTGGCPYVYCNVNEIPYPDVGDLTVLVAYLFRGGPKP